MKPDGKTAFRRLDLVRPRRIPDDDATDHPSPVILTDLEHASGRQRSDTAGCASEFDGSLPRVLPRFGSAKIEENPQSENLRTRVH
jgi:hypothetical protein